MIVTIKLLKMQYYKLTKVYTNKFFACYKNNNNFMYNSLNDFSGGCVEIFKRQGCRVCL